MEEMKERSCSPTRRQHANGSYIIVPHLTYRSIFASHTDSDCFTTSIRFVIMPFKKRAAVSSPAISGQEEAGPSTRAGGSFKRTKREPSPDAPSDADIEPVADEEPPSQIVDNSDEPPLIPALKIPGLDVRPCHDNDQLIVSEVLLFPPNLEFLKPKREALFSINCTPQIRFEVPPRVIEAMGRKQRNGFRPQGEYRRYIHIGRTNALGFPLHFYALVKSVPAWRNFVVDEAPAHAYKEWYDSTMAPALNQGRASTYGIHWGTWQEHETVRSVTSRATSGKSIRPIEQNLPVTAVQNLWQRLVNVDQGRHLSGAVLFAYGDMQSGEKTTWTDFAKSWARNVHSENLGEGSKVTTSIALDLNVAT